MANPTLVLLPIWGTGHVIPMLEAGKRLVANCSRDLSLTVLVMPPPTPESAAEVADLVRREEAASSSDLVIRFHNLPSIKPPSDDLGIDHFISESVRLHVPHIRDAISALESPVAGLVIDFFCTTVLDVSRELAIPTYVYFASNASTFSLLLHFSGFNDDPESKVVVPGLPLMPRSSLPQSLVDKTSVSYKWFLYHSKRYLEATGIIINTVAKLEHGVLAAVAGRAPPVYTIGPVLSLKPTSTQPHECVRWLDTQPPASVVLLCFGSMGSFAPPQILEMAHGLERSGHRFLWVLRGQPEAGGQHPTDANVEELLPEGFIERTRGKGLVWPTSAPQKEILAHASVGGFVTHCGWNSVLESLWFGVPMVPWPLYAEQHYNAFVVVSDIGVAVTMKTDRTRDNWVDSSELERAVKSLMGGDEEGRKAREKAMEMKDACRKAVEKGGSSYSALQSLHARAAGQQVEMPTKAENDHRV